MLHNDLLLLPYPILPLLQLVHHQCDLIIEELVIITVMKGRGAVMVDL